MKSLTIERMLFFALQWGITLLVAYLLILSAFGSPKGEKVETYVPAAARSATSSPFQTVQIEARAAIAYDISAEQVLYDKRKDDILPIASIAKLMTAHTASILLPENTVVPIEEEDAGLISSAGIVAGERWTLRDLMAFTLVSSSNGGAQAIAREAEKETNMNFVREMNSLAREIGLQNTLFRNETGLNVYDNEVSGSYSTAREIARLYAYLLKSNPKILESTNQAYLTAYSLDNIEHHATNTNWNTGRIPRLISSKTGTTNLAGGNLAIVFEPLPGRPIAIVVLGSTPQGRFTDIDKLVQATMESFQ